jgi:hypothetical protein
VGLTKREHVRPAITVRPDGPLAGHEFSMHRLGAAEWIALRRGDLDDGQLVAAAMDAVIDSTIPEDTELDMFEGLALMRAWTKAHKDDAFPPADGETSPEP